VGRFVIIAVNTITSPGLYVPLSVEREIVISPGGGGGASHRELTRLFPHPSASYPGSPEIHCQFGTHTSRSKVAVICVGNCPVTVAENTVCVLHSVLGVSHIFTKWELIPGLASYPIISPILYFIIAGADAVYFGWGAPFRGIRIDIGTPAVGSAGVWEYYNGATWETIPGLVDGTTGLTAAAGNHDVTFTPPSDWATVDPGAASTETLYYVRFRVTAANFTTIPIFDQVWLEGGHNEYDAAQAVINRLIALANTINPGMNIIRMIVHGKHYSSTDYNISIAGVSLQ